MGENRTLDVKVAPKGVGIVCTYTFVMRQCVVYLNGSRRAVLVVTNCLWQSQQASLVAFISVEPDEFYCPDYM